MPFALGRLFWSSRSSRRCNRQGNPVFCQVPRYSGNVPRIVNPRVMATNQFKPQSSQHARHARCFFTPPESRVVHLDIDPLAIGMGNEVSGWLANPALIGQHPAQVPVATSDESEADAGKVGAERGQLGNVQGSKGCEVVYDLKRTATHES